MKPSRILSVALTTALVAAGTVLMASPASAADTVGDGTFYGASDFGNETSSGYPGGVDWFFGQVSGTEGPHAFTRNGLELNASLTGDVQILNQNVGTQPTSAAELETQASTFDVLSSGPDNWVKQLAFFAEGTTGFTTLRPTSAGSVGGTDWITSQAFGSYAAGATDTLANFADELFLGVPPQLLAYGVFVDSSVSSTILAIHWGPDVSFFAPTPTRTASVSSITTTQFSTPGQGLTLTGTNWLPNSGVFVHIDNGSGSALIDQTFQADALGNVSVNVVLPSAPTAGTYAVTFDDDGIYFGSGVFGDPFMQLAVTEPAPELAATGTSPVPFVAGGILTLLLGGALLLTARRRARLS